jgi:inosine-uridine nucleoside N-ribohydrolase
LGGAVLPDPETKATDGAVDFLIETVSARPRDITLIAVGPLTNLALAEQQMPGILKKTKRIIIMGGAILEPGNVTPTAEFNFFADPHAAQVVVRSGAALTLIPLDVTHRVGLTEPVIAKRILPLGTPEAKFVVEATQKVLALGEKSGRHRVVFLHDPMAVAMAIDPIMFQTVVWPIDVETEGVLTLGQIVTDRRVFVLGGKQKGYSTGCAMGVNCDMLLHLFLSRILNLTDG